MRTITTYKAQRIFATRPIESVRIDISNEIPDSGVCESLEETRQLYHKEAFALADALFSTLPGGLVDALLAEMMKRRSTLLKIPL